MMAMKRMDGLAGRKGRPAVGPAVGPVAGRMIGLYVLLVALLGWASLAGPAHAGEMSRDELRGFLEVTGFDIAITSMQQGAMAGPGVAGEAPESFGAQYRALAEAVFAPEAMLTRAVDMMEAVMPDALVAHGVAFYGTELGQRLVAAENASHMAPDDVKAAEGAAELARLAEENPERLADYDAMTVAIGGVDASLKAVIEIQVRYIMAEAAATGEALEFSEAELRQLIASQAPAIRADMQEGARSGAAYAYMSFSDADVRAYREALEADEMRQVYEVLNAIQFEIMAERYEVLAGRLAELEPQIDI